MLSESQLGQSTQHLEVAKELTGGHGYRGSNVRSPGETMVRVNQINAF